MKALFIKFIHFFDPFAEPLLKKILISGWYGFDNAGDDAILYQFLQEMAQSDHVTVLSERPQRVTDLMGSSTTKVAFHHKTLGPSALRSALTGQLWQHIMRIKNADLFVLGGGGLLRDNTSIKNVCRLLDEIFWAKLFGKSVALYAIGVGPFTSRFGTWLIKLAVNLCDLITVRETQSKELLESLSIASDRIHVVADPAFLLQGTPPNDTALLERVKQRKLVGVFPSLGFVRDGKDFSHVPRLAAALDQIHEQHKVNFLALPMRFLRHEQDDVYVGNLVKQMMKYPHALDVYDDYLEPAELKWLAGRFLFNITVRLHAMIFSLSEETPVVAINYEPKVSNVIKSFGLDDYLVQMDEELQPQLVKAADQCLREIESYRRHIASRLPACKESAKRTFDLLRHLLHS